MNRLAGLLLAGLLASPVCAQPGAADHGAHHAGPAADMTIGEVRKVDQAAGKITLKHAEIKALDMPAMTMVFAVADRTMLDAVKVGDPVRFKAAKRGGALTVTAIEVLR